MCFIAQNCVQNQTSNGMQIAILTVLVQKRGNIKGASGDVLQQIAITI